jgi:hypothetical protein
VKRPGYPDTACDIARKWSSFLSFRASEFINTASQINNIGVIFYDREQHPQVTMKNADPGFVCSTLIGVAKNIDGRRHQ